MEPKVLLFSILGAIWILGVSTAAAFIIRAKIRELERLRKMKYFEEKEKKYEIQ